MPEARVTYQTAQEAVYERLRADLREGDSIMHQGVALRELSDRLGVSTMPVREAVRRLEAEGLVTFDRRSGVRAAPLSGTDFREITDIRVRLETLAWEGACARATDSDVSRVADLFDKMEKATDGSHWRQLNHEFHASIYSIAAYPRLLAIIENLWVVIEPYLKLYTSRDGYQRGQEEHRLILEALKARDCSGGSALIEAHIRNLAAALLADPDFAGLIRGE